MSAVMEKENGFKHFLELPSDIRQMMINEMCLDDKCRLSGTSKFCRLEVTTSKNLVHELQLNITESNSQIIVRYGNPDKADEWYQGFLRRFEHKQGVLYEKYKNLKGQELWVSELENPGNLAQNALEYFKNLLDLHQSNIKKLGIQITHPAIDDYDFEVRNLKKLEKLTVSDGTDIRDLLSKTTKKLVDLSVLEVKNGRRLKNFDEIYQFRKSFYSPYTQLSLEQFNRLSIPYVTIHIGNFTEDDIFDVVKSWKQSDKQVDRYRWLLSDSDFDVKKLFRMFGVEHDHPYKRLETEIEHEIQYGKKAMLYYTNYPFLVFHVQDNFVL